MLMQSEIFCCQKFQEMHYRTFSNCKNPEMAKTESPVNKKVVVNTFAHFQKWFSG